MLEASRQPHQCVRDASPQRPIIGIEDRDGYDVMEVGDEPRLNENREQLGPEGIAQSALVDD